MSKFCKMCGEELPNEETAYCSKCGANQYEFSNNGSTAGANAGSAQNGYSQSVNSSYNMKFDRKITGIGEWIGWLFLCSFLPIIGQIIMLCTSNDESVKNYAKANLIFVLIAIILIIVITVFIVIAGVSMSY